MPVDGGHEQRTGVIAAAHLVDVGAAVEQCHRGFDFAFANREQERRQPALHPEQFVVGWVVVVESAATLRREARFLGRGGITHTGNRLRRGVGTLHLA